MEYHNSLCSIIKDVHKSHEALIHAVCAELECDERADDIVKKLLDTAYSSVKPKKDPNRVKRAKSAYLYFCAERRPVLQTQHKGSSMGDISKLLGEEWHKLNDDDKKPFVELHEKDVDRYETEK